jgi:hypothetical protein
MEVPGYPPASEDRAMNPVFVLLDSEAKSFESRPWALAGHDQGPSNRFMVARGDEKRIS